MVFAEFEFTPLLPSQLALLETLKKELQAFGLVGEPVILTVVSLSGVGKSTIIQELLTFFPTSDSNHSQELSVIMVGTTPIVIIQETVSPSFIKRGAHSQRMDFSPDFQAGLSLQSIQVLQNPLQNFEAVYFAHRTLSMEEAATLITADQVPSGVTPEELNTLTLGIPKLILQCQCRLNKAQVVNVVLQYLTQYFTGIEDLEELRVAINFFQDVFLHEDRRIPLEIISQIPDFMKSLHQKGVFGLLVGEHKNRVSQFTYESLLLLHQVTRDFYTQFEGESTQKKKSFEVQAWIDMDGVDVDALAQEFEVQNPILDKPQYGKPGKFLDQFKLTQTRIGYSAMAGVGGANDKTEFAFQFTSGGKLHTISNFFNESLFLSPTFFSHGNTPNFRMIVRNHNMYGPATTVCSLEAILQKIGIRYRVTRPTAETFEFDPISGKYVQFFSKEELRKQKKMQKPEKRR